MTYPRGRGAPVSLRLLLPLLLLALLAACAEPSDEAAPVSPGVQPAADDDLMLRVDFTGGFVTPSMLAARLPLISVYGDGRVISEGPQIAIYPSPAVPNVQVRHIGREDVERLVALALDAGVGTESDVGQPPIADATSTRFTVTTSNGVETTEVYALAETDRGTAGLTDAQQEARTELRALLDALTDLEQTLGADAVTEAEPYEPAAAAVIATPWADPGDGLGQQQELAWPGPELPGKSLAEGLDISCVTLTGETADEFLAAAQAANSATPWTSGGKRWNLTLRPLLPDESTCADLARNS